VTMAQFIVRHLDEAVKARLKRGPNGDDKNPGRGNPNLLAGEPVAFLVALRVRTQCGQDVLPVSRGITRHHGGR
jgi:hypothetical protein